MRFSIYLFVMSILLSIFFNLLIMGLVKPLLTANNICIIFLSASIDHFSLWYWSLSLMIIWISSIFFILCLSYYIEGIMQFLWILTSFTKMCWILFLQAVELSANYFDHLKLDFYGGHILFSLSVVLPKKLGYLPRYSHSNLAVMPIFPQHCAESKI